MQFGNLLLRSIIFINRGTDGFQFIRSSGMIISCTQSVLLMQISVNCENKMLKRLCASYANIE